jgi:acid stress-induced BolA-like protein IbaG/YrbA
MEAYKDKEYYRNEDGIIEYDAYYDLNRDILTLQDMHDIVGSIYEWFRDDITEDIRGIYYWFDEYITNIKYDDNIQYQFVTYGKIIEICDDLKNRLIPNWEYDDEMKIKYPNFLEDFEEIRNDAINYHCNELDKKGANEIFQYTSIFELVDNVLDVMKKYAVYEPLVEYLNKKGNK